MSKLLAKFMTIAFVATITGCFYSVDVTNDPDFYYGYRKGQVYENRIDLYIIYGWDNYLVLPGKDTPKIDEYLTKPSKYGDIKGILKEKSRVRIEKLSYRRTFEASYLDVYARILNGEYKDESVELNLVSTIEVKQQPKGGFMPKPDPSLMKLMEGGEK